MLARRFPKLGLPAYDAAQGIDIWHMQAFWLVIFVLVAVLVGVHDRWLGAGVLMLGLGIFFWAGTFDITHRIVTLVGILALWAMRHTPIEWRPMVTSLLAASGIFQAVYALQQHFGYDVLWGPWIAGPGYVLRSQSPQCLAFFAGTGPEPAGGCFLQPLGTLGTVDAASAYVAITAPLMPIWALPLAVGIVLAGKSIGAILAICVGLLVRWHYHHRSPAITTTAATVVLTAWLLRYFHHGTTADWNLTAVKVAFLVMAWLLILAGYLAVFHRAQLRMPESRQFRAALGAVLGVALIAVFTWPAWRLLLPAYYPATAVGRVQIWWFGLADWWQTNPIFGVAPWAQRIPALQVQQNFRPNNEIWMEAHSEYLQWLYQYGLLGFSILGLWLWEHRAMFRDRMVGASLCALAIVSGSFFTFHVASVALAGICLVGLATAYSERQDEGRALVS